MKNYPSLIKELNSLPKGYISKKTIHGDDYFYLQFFDNGKLKSKYIKKADLSIIESGLKRRKEIENLLDNKGKLLPELSKNSKELTGFIMMSDTKVASFDKGVLSWMDEDKVPLAIKHSKRLEPFLKLRSIDTGRTNSRLLKKVLRIQNVDDERIVLYAHAATLTDNYWFKPKGSRLHYSDISFDSDIYSDIALKGEILYYPRKSQLSPELTLTGSYEKCWKKDGNHWYMYKVGNNNEIISEIFASRLAEKLNIPTAKYEKDGDYIKTENFAYKVNFEPMASIVGSDDSYENVFKSLSIFDEEIKKQYLYLMCFDLIINNVDRHNENMGLLRDRKTGKIISLAPNFDNNLCLISRSIVLNMDPSKDGMITLFFSFIKKNKEAKDILKSISFINLNEKDVDECLNELVVDADIKTYVLGRYEYIKQSICNL